MYSIATCLSRLTIDHESCLSRLTTDHASVSRWSTVPAREGVAARGSRKRKKIEVSCREGRRRFFGVRHTPRLAGPCLVCSTRRPKERACGSPQRSPRTSGAPALSSAHICPRMCPLSLPPLSAPRRPVIRFHTSDRSDHCTDHIVHLDRTYYCTDNTIQLNRSDDS